MDIKFFNTLTRQKEKFVPIKDGRVSLYACGPTVYDYAHIGNFRTFIFEDILHRTLTYAGYDVLFVQNITDVGHLAGDSDTGEDKIEKGAKDRGKTAQELAEMFTEIYKQDSKELNIIEADILAKATEHISEQIEMVSALEQKGFTYKTSDGIYFDTSKISDYGKLANLNSEKIKEGARIEVNPEKRNSTDFALWKFSKPEDKRQMEWDSPWGVGFPGWHIECSAMSTKYLGVPFDIHAGGIDFIPLHHTNEIAQNEAVFSKKTVNYWMHGGFLMVDDQKMSKSLQNIYSLKDLKEKNIRPISFRYFILTAHYKKPINFTWQAMDGAQNSYKKMVDKISNILKEKGSDKDDGGSKEKAKKYIDSFREAIYDDLNMPEALAITWAVLNDTELTGEDKIETIKDFDKVLGLNLLESSNKKLLKKDDIPEKIKNLAKEREQSRQNGDWNRADTIRKEIESFGYKIKDQKDHQIIEKID